MYDDTIYCYVIINSVDVARSTFNNEYCCIHGRADCRECTPRRKLGMGLPILSVTAVCRSRGGFTKPSLGLVVGRGDGDDGPRAQGSTNLETIYASRSSCVHFSRAGAPDTTII
jgi:hypothetical protein